MVKINRKVEYALMVLKLMNERSGDELTTAREVCDLFKTPFDTTAKVMQQLNLNGILTSHKGVKGGYQLSIDLHQLSYLSLVEIIEGKASVVDCNEGPCDLIHSCNISAPIKRFNNYLTNILSSLSVYELVAQEDFSAVKTCPPLARAKELV